ncbi:wall-associated receptor kinase 2 [Ricinus communis]|uniref:Serine-threonine protein kinase, plant-type, putative n=1 Tax=Ricinus communis TaxID=3988 RepID=B9SNI9_RICCO|nr:wall-associated receptor kinase 2 [Ricinus communis]EEF34810.1 serine-threonine protein kinase, plant-type, putative [Ricinus communis]|eukprot:XP_002527558.1 wall-associated receptor kinase 2 [Ricinus communis]
MDFQLSLTNESRVVGDLVSSRQTRYVIYSYPAYEVPEKVEFTMRNVTQVWLFCFAKLLFWQCIYHMTVAEDSDSLSNVKPDCQEKCGNVSVFYPFGIDNPDCAFNEFFLLTCNYSYTPELMIGNIPVLDISVQEGVFSVDIENAYECYDSRSGQIYSFDQIITLGDGPFRFSDIRNKLTATGCDSLAFMTDAEGDFGSGCVSLCNGPVNFTKESSCGGYGCCQTSIPQSLKTLNISLTSPNSRMNVWDFNPCGFAFLADQRNFNVSNLNLTYSEDEFISSTSVIEWVVEEKTCGDANKSDSYACRRNTDCIYSENGQGYRCSCKEGFAGNPYIEGCEDIDECNDPLKYPCQGTCKNTFGNYTCSCPLGMRGDGKVGCRGFRITALATVVGAFIFAAIIGLLVVIIWKKHKKQKNFLENGGVLLKHQRVRIFKEAELAKATNYYTTSNFLGEGGFGCVYKGVLADGTQVAVKRPKDIEKMKMNQEFQKEIGIVSQVNHINVVKVLGLCLETNVPLLVYEFVSNGNLYQHIHQKRSQLLTAWKNILRIAAETALALDYLHSLANPPIIHGDVKSANILLDENYTAKVSDFGASVLISSNQTDMATKIQGTFGYLDPEYLMTGNLTEKSDVYSFGVVLVELLTGEKPNSNPKSGEKNNIIQYFLSSLENGDLNQIPCFEITSKEEMEEIEVFAELAKQCLRSSGIKRPTMNEVAHELVRLRKLHESSWSQHNSNETEHLLQDDSSSFFVDIGKLNLQEVLSVKANDIEYPTDSR